MHLLTSCVSIEKSEIKNITLMNKVNYKLILKTT